MPQQMRVTHVLGVPMPIYLAEPGYATALPSHFCSISFASATLVRFDTLTSASHLSHSHKEQERIQVNEPHMTTPTKNEIPTSHVAPRGHLTAR